ncbi:MAG: hypothetical protein IPI60_14135 [Saprospiraceae bacterium]|nr:hypothetical protein [Saprospiraceae bacterium]
MPNPMLEEKLKLLPAWLLTFLVMDFVIILVILFAISKNEDSQDTIQMMLISGAIFTLVFVLLNFIHYKVKMEYRHFSVKMVPFSLKAVIVEPDDILAMKIRPLHVLREFSGLGKRIKGDTTAYVTDSKFAIEFNLSTGKKMVVSIRNKEEWQRIFEGSSVWAQKMRME